MLRKTLNSNEQIGSKVNYALEKYSKVGSRKETKKNCERSTNPDIYVEIMKKTQLDRGDTGKLPEKDSPKAQLEKIKEDVLKNQSTNHKDVKHLLSQLKRKKTDKVKNVGQCSINLTNTATKKYIEKSFIDEPQYKTTNLEERKRLRDKYTFKFKSAITSNEAANLSSGEDIKTGTNEKLELFDKNGHRLKKPNQEVLIYKDKAGPLDSQLSEGKIKKEIDTQISKPTSKYKNDQSQHKEPDRKEDFERKPIIKTITSRHDTKVYKAVTFIDQKKKPAQLRINIPNAPMRKLKQPKSSPSPSAIPRLVRSKTRVQMSPTQLSEKAKSSGSKTKPTTSKTSVKDKKRKNEKRRIMNSSPELNKSRSRVLSSPDLSIAESPPPTEVAKWAPASVNRHTQPYYEAWVNTTLAAISKDQPKEISDKKLIRSFEKALLQRPQTPELEYIDMNDERYTGRIKIRQR